MDEPTPVESSDEPVVPSQPAKVPMTPAIFFRLALFIGIPVIILVSCTAAVFKGASSVGSQPDEFDAQVICQDWVKDKLKAPATAEFGSITRSGSLASGFTISGTVDSENSYGAKLRSTWVCLIHANGDKWSGNVSIA